VDGFVVHEIGFITDKTKQRPMKPERRRHMSKARCMVLVTFLLQGVYAAGAQSVRPPEEAACGAINTKLKIQTDKKHHPVGTATPGKALIYIIQVEKGKEPIRYGMDGRWIGGNYGDSYFFTTVEPGDHGLCGDWQHKILFTSKPVSVTRACSHYRRASMMNAK
jgi:hypothetical protein